MIRPPPRSTLTDPLFPYTTLFRSIASGCLAAIDYGTAFDHMHVAQPPAGQRQPGGFIRVEQASEQPCVLMQAHRAIGAVGAGDQPQPTRSEEHTSELQSLMRISYDVFCLKKKNTILQMTTTI